MIPTNYLSCWPLDRGLRCRAIDEQGSVAVEHATVLGAIAVGVLLTVGIVGQNMARKFDDVANLMESDSASTVTDGNGVRRPNQQLTDDSLSESLTVRWSLALGLIAAPGLIWFALHRLHQRRLREMERPDADSAQR